MLILFVVPMQNVINQFTRLGQDARVSFLGNVTVGADISLASLRQHYNGVCHLQCSGTSARHISSVSSDHTQPLHDHKHICHPVTWAAEQ